MKGTCRVSVQFLKLSVCLFIPFLNLIKILELIFYLFAPLLDILTLISLGLISLLTPLTLANLSLVFLICFSLILNTSYLKKSLSGFSVLHLTSVLLLTLILKSPIFLIFLVLVFLKTLLSMILGMSLRFQFVIPRASLTFCCSSC